MMARAQVEDSVALDLMLEMVVALACVSTFGMMLR